MLRLFLLIAICAGAQDLAKYPAKVVLDSRTLAAEFLIHSIPTPQGVWVTDNYLVIDAAFFGEGNLRLSSSQFKLQLNKKKELLFPQTPTWVASSMRDPAW